MAKFALYNKDIKIDKKNLRAVYGSLASARTARSKFVKIVPSAKNKIGILKL